MKRSTAPFNSTESAASVCADVEEEASPVCGISPRFAGAGQTACRLASHCSGSASPPPWRTVHSHSGAHTHIYTQSHRCTYLYTHIHTATSVYTNIHTQSQQVNTNTHTHSHSSTHKRTHTVTAGTKNTRARATCKRSHVHTKQTARTHSYASTGD